MIVQKGDSIRHKSISADSFAFTEPCVISEYVLLILKVRFMVPSLGWAVYAGCP